MRRLVKKDTHKPFFQVSSSSSTSSLHHHHPPTSTLRPPRSSAPRLLEAVYSARTRGPRAGTMASFRETINPMAEQGSLQGGQPTPFPQTSQPSATLSAYTYMSHTLTDTHLVSLSATDIPECCSEIRTVQTGGSSSEPTPTDFLKSCCLGDVSSIQDPHAGFVYGGGGCKCNL